MLDANKHTQIYILFICLGLEFRRLGLHNQSFLIINIIFPEFNITWILKKFVALTQLES